MTPQINPEDFYAPSEIADMLKISTITVRRKLAEGAIKSRKVGRQIRVVGSDLLTWLETDNLASVGNPETTLFAEVDRYSLYKGDSLTFMASLNPASVDMVFADPPYYLSNDGTTCYAGKRVSVNKGMWDKSAGFFEDHRFNKAWLARAQQILKESGTIFVSGTFHAIFSLGFAMQELGYKILNVITWYKPNAAPNLSGRYFAHSTEFVIWAAPKENKTLKHVFNYELLKKVNGGKQMRDVWFDAWAINTPPPPEKVFGKHPTQKPVELVRRCIIAATQPDGLVFDPFCGAGTTGVAALITGRRFVGIDLDEQYLTVANKRLSEVQANPTLFNGEK